MCRKVPFIICFLIVFRINISKAQDTYVKGIVTNANLEPIALVNVSVVDFAYLNTSTSISGEYKVNIKEGSYVFVFTFDGYKTLKMPIIVRGTDVIQNIILEDNAIELESAKVVNKSKHKSIQIINHEKHMPLISIHMSHCYFLGMQWSDKFQLAGLQKKFQNKNPMITLQPVHGDLK